MRQKTEYRVGVGASSILMILVVLSLTALSLLSLSSARNNQALSDRNLSMTVQYYEAAASAQRKLAAMDAVLVQHAGAALTRAQWQSVFDVESLTDIRLTDALTFAFTVDAGAGRTLTVEGTLTPDALPRYHLTCHELRSTALETEQPLLLLNPPTTAPAGQTNP